MNKVIIVGCGRVGSKMAIDLNNQGYKVTVIDRDPLALRKLDDVFTGNKIVGTGIDEEVLINAGIEKASALITVAKGDNTNIMVGQISKFIFNVPKVILRIVDPKCKKFYEEKIGMICYCQTEVSVNSYIKLLKGEEICI
ncbi:MAG: NAD-binding protein [Clostridiales bacterium]